MDKVMTGAMHGLADSLDPGQRVSVGRSGQADRSERAAAGRRRRHRPHAAVLACASSPRATAPRRRKAGLRTGDYVRLIGETPTREMSVFEGMRALRGAPGSKVSLTIIRGNTNDPHVVELTREAVPTTDVTSRTAAPGVGYLRVAAFSRARRRRRRPQWPISPRAAPPN